MRTTGLSAIQQTLTPEALTILTHSIAESARRSHGQTTPLHVAATLLSSPAGFLRQACIRSHPNSSHPLQCRALELCFSVALERLPAGQTAGEPAISNALMAALKRAQAHQRRGSPENQQQPLLAVKVEIEQLIISILDDPSVSRVMREASFSSPAVKSAIEHGLGYRPGPNLYLNPRIHDVRRVIDILSRPKKRNPVLVGEFEPHEVVREVLQIRNGVLQDVEVVSVGAVKVNELCGFIEKKMAVNVRGVIVDLGDLKWLVDQPCNEAAREAVSEMGRMMRKYGGCGEQGSKIWVIGTSTCETYLRCQVYHPTMENEWDLQVVSIVARSSSIHGILPRLGSNSGILTNSIEYLSPMNNFSMSVPPRTRRVSEDFDPFRRFRCCPQCTEKCYREVMKLKAEESGKSPELDAISDKLPPWLRNAKLHAHDELQGTKNYDLREKTQELQKKWCERCVELHPNFHHQSPLLLKGLHNPSLLGLQPNIIPAPRPDSPVKTDLILGPTNHAKEKFVEGDVHLFKRLLKGLTEKVWWQSDAASSLASAITDCKLGNGKRRVGGSRWLLFAGPDRTGKRNMASALSELEYGVKPTVISLGTRRYGDESSELNFRGKTMIDKIVEAVRRNNPPSVIVLDDIHEADMVVRSSVKRAMERGRMVDSHGREISLGNSIFVITSSCVPHQQLVSDGGLSEERMTSLASGGWQLRISVMCEKSTIKSKRPPPDWLLDRDNDAEKSTKQRREEIGSGISFDLNRTADNEDDGSNNSSDVTVDHEDERVPSGSPTSSSTSYELLNCVDEAIIFKPVDMTPVRQNLEKTIKTKFSTVVGETVLLKIENEALERIMSGVWIGQTGLDTWLDKVLGPSIIKLKMKLSSLVSHLPEGRMVAHLELDKETESRGQGDWLPGEISVVAGTENDHWG